MLAGVVTGMVLSAVLLLVEDLQYHFENGDELDLEVLVQDHS